MEPVARAFVAFELKMNNIIIASSKEQKLKLEKVTTRKCMFRTLLEPCLEMVYQILMLVEKTK